MDTCLRFLIFFFFRIQQDGRQKNKNTKKRVPSPVKKGKIKYNNYRPDFAVNIFNIF